MAVLRAIARLSLHLKLLQGHEHCLKHSGFGLQSRAMLSPLWRSRSALAERALISGYETRLLNVTLLWQIMRFRDIVATALCKQGHVENFEIRQRHACA